MSATQKFFRYTFGLTGDRTAVPDATAGDGSVSYQQGYGLDYQRQKTDPLAKNIERDKMNQLLGDITQALQQYQTNGVPEFIVAADNGAVAYSYSEGAFVLWTVASGGDGAVYQSTSAANNTTPADATKWRRVIASAFLTGTIGGTANVITATGVGNPAVTSVAQVRLLSVRHTAANTGATTLQVNATAAKGIVTGAGVALTGGEIPGAGFVGLYSYDATADKYVLLNPAPAWGQDGPIINGGALVQQRAAIGTVSLSATHQYGAADRWAVAALGGSGFAGTVGVLAGLATVTGTGVGAVAASWTNGQFSCLQRIESRDALPYASKTITVSGKIYHDFGAPVNFNVNVSSANAVDNFGTVTSVGTSPNISVPTGAPTPFSFTLTLTGACGNGFHAQVLQTAVNTVAAKNCVVADMKVELGTSATAFVPRPYAQEFELCRRYWRRQFGGALGSATAAAQNIGATQSLEPPMRAVPSSNGSSVGNTNAGATTVDTITATSLRYFAASVGSGNVQVNLDTNLFAEL